MSDLGIKADFYEVAGARLDHDVCERVFAHYEAGERVYLWAGSDSSAKALDEALWTFRENSFVPHSLAGATGTADDPVVVGTAPKNPGGATRLVVAGSPEAALLIEMARNFKAVTDFVPKNDRAATARARERYKVLRDAGFEMSHHPLGMKED